MKVIACYSIKGGVGKTATAVNLAYLSSRAGARTLIWDLDPQGAASFYFRVRLKNRRNTARALLGERSIESQIRGTDFDGLDLIPAGASLRHIDVLLSRSKRPTRQLSRLLAPLASSYDHVYLDCAPGITLAAEAVFGAAAALVIPTIPTVLALRTLAQLHDFLDERRADKPGSRSPLLLPFYSMVDRRKNLHREVVEGKHAVSIPALSATIPYSSVVERTGLARAPLPALAPRHPVTKSYVELWREIQLALRALEAR